MKRFFILASLFLFLCSATVSHGFVEKRFPYKLGDVLKASKFVRKQGYWEGYNGNELVGYVMLSNDWTPHLIGYSSKPLNTLIGMDSKGNITGIKIVSYWEPIFMIGIKDSDYHKFLQQYMGRNINDPITVGKEITMDAITGATVTAIVQNATNLGTTRSVAALVGITQKIETKVAKKVGRISEKYESLSWSDMFATGALKSITITTKDLEMKGEEDVYLELNAGIVTPPSIGKNLLGEKFYKDIMKEIKDGESGLFICSTKGSFKGVGFAYGGIFGTLNIEQDGKIFVFTTDEYENVTHLYVKGIPSVSEAGVFIIRGKYKEIFDQTRPFKLHITLPYYIGGKKKYKTFTMEYKLPERFIK